MAATTSYLNLYCFPRSGRALELNFNALLIAIAYPDEITPEQAFWAVITGRRPKPTQVKLTVPQEDIKDCIELQAEGFKLRDLSYLLNVSESRLCRNMQRYRREILKEDLQASYENKMKFERQIIINTMVRGSKEGKTMQEMAADCGISKLSIARYLKSKDFLEAKKAGGDS
ncbi:MAG: hypothetical protein GX279_09975 [Clostridiaceae bacterium]|nr:hypothetical protein [Clostridiaceae bacterium]